MGHDFCKYGCGHVGVESFSFQFFLATITSLQHSISICRYVSSFVHKIREIHNVRPHIIFNLYCTPFERKEVFHSFEKFYNFLVAREVLFVLYGSHTTISISSPPSEPRTMSEWRIRNYNIFFF